jgi:hypothetical protein
MIISCSHRSRLRAVALDDAAAHGGGVYRGHPSELSRRA